MVTTKDLSPSRIFNTASEPIEFVFVHAKGYKSTRKKVCVHNLKHSFVSNACDPRIQTAGYYGQTEKISVKMTPNKASHPIAPVAQWIEQWIPKAYIIKLQGVEIFSIRIATPLFFYLFPTFSTTFHRIRFVWFCALFFTSTRVYGFRSAPESAPGFYSVFR